MDAGYSSRSFQPRESVFGLRVSESWSTKLASCVSRIPTSLIFLLCFGSPFSTITKWVCLWVTPAPITLPTDTYRPVVRFNFKVWSCKLFINFKSISSYFFNRIFKRIYNYKLTGIGICLQTLLLLCVIHFYLSKVRNCLSQAKRKKVNAILTQSKKDILSRRCLHLWRDSRRQLTIFG